MARHGHKTHKKAHGGKIPKMDSEYKEVTEEDHEQEHKRGGKTHKRKRGGHAGGKKSHERMDKRARGGAIQKLKSGGKSSEWALSANSSRQPLTQAAKVTSAGK